jgi:hypothetical protein
MCRCTPALRTPFCSKPGCEWPLKPDNAPPRTFDYPITGYFPYVRPSLISEREIDGNAPGDRDAETGALLKPPDRMLKFFAFEHLRPDLQEVSKPFSELAQRLVELVPAGAERTVALRKLLEAKDAAVRAVAIPD